jgi:hypothetical protein
LVNELARETAPGHLLHGVPTQALARSGIDDDVLFALLDGSGRVAVVHLTWSQETSPWWPGTRLFANREAWLREARGAGSGG